MYTIRENSMLEIQIVGRVHSQRTRNVFHYLYPPGSVDLPDGKTAAENALDDFQQNVLNGLLLLVASEWFCDRLTAQWVLPDRYRAVADTTGWVGQVQENALPSYCAVVISKYAELSGGEFQGRNYFAGIPVTSENNSSLGALAKQAWDAFAPNLIVPLNLGLPASDVFLVTKTPASLNPIDTASIVTETNVNPVLRAQRRREVGVGE